jgi:hypothetical protein
MSLLATVVLASLALTSVALSAGGPPGTYATTIKSPAQLKGKWVLTFTNGGTYTVAVNGQRIASGRYSATARTITLDRERGSGCTGAGTYAWTKSGKTMTFTRKKESPSCQARAVVLSHRFTQVR